MSWKRFIYERGYYSKQRDVTNRFIRSDKIVFGEMLEKKFFTTQNLGQNVVLLSS